MPCMMYGMCMHSCMMHVHGRHSSWAPGAFYTYFYNHAHRLRLEKLLCIELSRSPSGYFFKTSESRQRFQKRNGRYELRNRFGSGRLQISPFHSRGAPGVFYTYFYNHARRLRLEKLFIQSFLEVPTGFFKYFWIQVAVSLSLSLLKPPHGGFRSETAVTKPFRK